MLTTSTTLQPSTNQKGIMDSKENQWDKIEKDFAYSVKVTCIGLGLAVVNALLFILITKSSELSNYSLPYSLIVGGLIIFISMLIGTSGKSSVEDTPLASHKQAENIEPTDNSVNNETNWD